MTPERRETAERIANRFPYAWQVALGGLIAAIPYAVMLAIICLFAWLVFWMMERDATWERRTKQDCVERGGKVIESVGGFTRFQCDGPTRF